MPERLAFRLDTLLKGLRFQNHIWLSWKAPCACIERWLKVGFVLLTFNCDHIRPQKETSMFSHSKQYNVLDVIDVQNKELP